jgi:peroxiredoxin
MRTRCFAFLLFCTLLFLAGAAVPSGAVLQKGVRAPAAPVLRDLDGAAFEAADYASDRLLLCFFSIYSDGAAESLELLERMNELAHSTRSGARVVGVDTDPSPDALRRFLGRQKVTFRVLMDGSFKVSDAFRVRRMPTFYFLDSGRVEEVVEGYSLKAAGRVKEAFENWTGAAAPPRVEKKNGHRVLMASGARQVRPSPTDPNRMFYISNDGVLWLYNIAARDRTPLVTDASAFDVSPDGGSVVFAGEEKNGVWIRAVDRGGPRRISVSGMRPAWSPRGGLIAYLVSPDQVWVYDIAEEKRWRVDAAGIEIQWSSDGAGLVVVDAKGRAWLISPFTRHSLMGDILR